MGKRLIYAIITCVAGLSLFSFTSDTAVKASGLLYILRTKFRHLSATVRRQSALGSMAMFTSALSLRQNFIMYVLLPIYHKTPAR